MSLGVSALICELGVQQRARGTGPPPRQCLQSGGKRKTKIKGIIYSLSDTDKHLEKSVQTGDVHGGFKFSSHQHVELEAARVSEIIKCAGREGRAVGSGRLVVGRPGDKGHVWEGPEQRQEQPRMCS